MLVLRGPATVAGIVIALAIASGASADGLAPPYDSLNLPAIPPTPWRFTGFPIIAWWGPPGTATQQDFQNYKDAGFTLHATNSDTGYFQALDFCDAVGLQSMSFQQTQGFGLPSDPTIVFPATRDTIAGWIVGDEPQSSTDVSTAITGVNQLEQADPSRWAFFNMLPPGLQGSPGTAPAMDAATHFGMPILSYDDYVIMDDGTDHTVQFYSDLQIAHDASVRDATPFWAFAVTVHHEGYLGWYRRPSESDLRWMQYSNLSYGAKGLWYFTYWAPSNFTNFDSTAIVDSTGAKSDLYDLVSTLNHEVLAHGDVLAGLTSDKVVHSDPPFGATKFVPGADWITSFEATSGLIGYLHDASNTSYAFVMNKQHGQNMTSAATAADLTLGFGPTVTGVEAVSWLDGTPGNLAIQDGSAGSTATLHVAGGTGVLLRATFGSPVDPGHKGGCSVAGTGDVGTGLLVVGLGWIARSRRRGRRVYRACYR